MGWSDLPAFTRVCVDVWVRVSVLCPQCLQPFASTFAFPFACLCFLSLPLSLPLPAPGCPALFIRVSHVFFVLVDSFALTPSEVAPHALSLSLLPLLLLMLRFLFSALTPHVCVAVMVVAPAVSP